MSVSRREFIGSAAMLAAAPALMRWHARPAASQAGNGFTDLRGGVGIFTGQGGTIGWLVTSDGAVAVDSQYPASARPCVDGLLDRSSKGIQILINTHHHADHVNGNPVFRKVVKSIVQQERCAKYHRDTTAAAGTTAQQAFADVAFGGSWSATIGNEKVWGVYAGPGHTGGDAIVVFEKANVVHMGDLMFNRMHPFIDRPNGASIQNWTRSLTKIADQHKDAVFIFGHAKPGLAATGTRADLLAFRDYLSAVLDHTQAGIRAGQPLKEIAAIDRLPGFEDYASAPPRLTLASSIAAAHEELSK